MNRSTTRYLLPLICFLLAGSAVAQPAFLQSRMLADRSTDRGENSPAAGTSSFGSNKYVEYIHGNLPIVISVPHGGYLTPQEIPDRELGTAGHTDVKTQELAHEIIDAFRQRTGKVPHVIIALLNRKKLDANRELYDATQDNPVAETAWREFHGFIDSAQQSVRKTFGTGLYVDLHGHRHARQLVELGYLLVSTHLQLEDSDLDRTVSVSATSLGLLINNNQMTMSELVRGPRSFGALLEARGAPALPGPVHRNTEGQPYFSGGYNLEQHSSFAGGVLSGLQIETPLSIREDEVLRKQFAAALVDALIEFLNDRGMAVF